MTNIVEVKSLTKQYIMPPEIWTKESGMLSSIRNDEKTIYPPIQSESSARNIA